MNEEMPNDLTPSGYSKEFWDNFFAEGIKKYGKEYNQRLEEFTNKIQDEKRINQFSNELYNYFLLLFEKAVNYHKEKQKKLRSIYCDQDGRKILNYNLSTNQFLGNYKAEGQEYWGKCFIWQAKFEPILAERFQPINEKAINLLEIDKKIKILKKYLITNDSDFYLVCNKMVDFVLLDSLPFNDLMGL